MRKIKIILVSIFAFLIFSMSVHAASGNLSVSSSSVYVGDSFTVSVNVNAAAAWNVHVSASGPVSGCVINQADATDDAMDTNKVFTASCTATGVGTITVSLSGDATSADDGVAVSLGGTKTVTVINKPSTPTPTPTPTPAPTPTPTPDNGENNLSNNNRLSKLEVEGYNLTKIDDNNYTLEVANNVTIVDVKATLEDSKAKVSGTGKHEIVVGENNIELVVTSESGRENKISIKVTRKDGYDLSDLDIALSDSTKAVDITINNDSTITSSILSKINDSNKVVNLNYYSDDKKLIYTWILDGNKIKNNSEFLTTILYKTDNKDDILKLSNYADGMYLSFSHSGKLPDGTMIKIYVGDKFKDGSLVNVYYYNNGKNLELVKKELAVVSGYVTFSIEHCSEYFVTMSNLSYISNDSNFENLVFIILSVLELIVIIVLIILLIRSKKNNSSKKDLTSNSDVALNDNNVSILEVENVKEDKVIENSSTQENESSNSELENDEIVSFDVVGEAPIKEIDNKKSINSSSDYY